MRSCPSVQAGGSRRDIDSGYFGISEENPYDLSYTPRARGREGGSSLQLLPLSLLNPSIVRMKMKGMQ